MNNTEDFLKACLEARLLLWLDGSHIRGRGPASAGPLEPIVRDHRVAVFAALTQAGQLLQQVRNAGYVIEAKDRQTISVATGARAKFFSALRYRKQATLMLLFVERAGVAAKPTLPAPAEAGASAAPNSGKHGTANESVAEWPTPLVFPETFADEHRFERALLQQRLRRCTDTSVANVLRWLVAEPAPKNETAWIVMGRRWRDIEHDLRAQGRLPEVPAAVAKQAA